MADNPYMNITDGIKTGMDYAFQKSGLELKQQQLQQQMDEHQAQKDQIQTAKADKLMGNVGKIAAETRPNVRKAMIAGLESQAQMFGVQLDPAVKASLNDDEYLSKYAETMNQYAQLPPDQRGKMFPVMSKFLSSSDYLKEIDKTTQLMATANQDRISNAMKQEDITYKRGEREDKDVEKFQTKIAEAIDPTKARGGTLKDAQANKMQAQRLEALVESARNGNLTAAQQEELGIGLNKLISGAGNVTDSQVKALVPSSAEGKVQNYASWLTNKPMGANQQAFTKLMQETIAREKEVAESQILDAQKKRLGGLDFAKLKNNPKYQTAWNTAVGKYDTLSDQMIPTDADRTDTASAPAPSAGSGGSPPPAAAPSAPGQAPAQGAAQAQQAAAPAAPAAPPNPLANFSDSQKQALNTLAKKKFSAKTIKQATGLELTKEQIKALGIKE